MYELTTYTRNGRVSQQVTADELDSMVAGMTDFTYVTAERWVVRLADGMLAHVLLLDS
jgi:hypothetical protein